MQRSNPSAMPRRPLRRRGEEGQALVEFSLVLPILCLLLFGIIQFGLLFYNYIDLTSATRDAARQVSVARASGLEGEDRVKAIVDDATTVVDDAKTTVNTTDGPWTAKEDVAVTVSYEYHLNILGLVIWNGPMVAKSIARIE